MKILKEGLLNLRVLVLVDGKSVLSKSFGVNATREEVQPPAKPTTSVPPATRTPPPPPTSPPQQQQSALPENLLEIVLAIALVVGVIVLLRMALVKSRRRERRETPSLEVPSAGLTPPVEEIMPAVSTRAPPEITPEEVTERPKFDEYEETEFEEEVSEIPPPEETRLEIREQPRVEEITPPTEHLPPPLEDEVVDLLNEAKNRLSRVKLKLSELEDIIGFEVSPYKLADVESKVLSAEMAYKARNFRKAREILEDVIEDLKSLENEVDEAKTALVDRWGSVESRIEVMLKVWGRAPANMLTMVPPGFRIVALERYRRMHEEKKLELSGDELYLVE